MDDAIKQALEHDRTIDITTTGRKSGQPRRIEIWFHNIDGEYYITGLPGTPGWYANMLAHPDFTFHLKQSAQADLPATATPVRDPAQREAVLTRICRNLGRDEKDIPARVAGSPLIHVVFKENGG